MSHSNVFQETEDLRYLDFNCKDITCNFHYCLPHTEGRSIGQCIVCVCVGDRDRRILCSGNVKEGQ